METVNVYEAKTRLSKLIDQAASGTDVIIARNGRPVARLTQIVAEKRPIRFGVLKGEVQISNDFDDPLPLDIAAAFEGS